LPQASGLLTVLVNVEQQELMELAVAVAVALTCETTLMPADHQEATAATVAVEEQEALEVNLEARP
jgi:hypothetical protein